jgi:hypothetical protein
MKEKVAKRTLEDEKQHLLLKMEKLEAGSPEYDDAARNYHRLCEAGSFRPSDHVTRDLIIGGGISLVSFLLVLYFERLDAFEAALRAVKTR